MTVSIREAGPPDAELVAAMFSEFNALLGADGLPESVAFEPENVKVSTEQMARRLAAIAGVERTFVAEVEGKGAGLGCLRLLPYVGQDVPYAEVTQLYVREGFRRHGVGAALLASLEQRALAAGPTCVHIITGRDDTGAQALYEAHGYDAICYEYERFFGEDARA